MTLRCNNQGISKGAMNRRAEREREREKEREKKREREREGGGELTSKRWASLPDCKALWRRWRRGASWRCLPDNPAWAWSACCCGTGRSSCRTTAPIWRRPASTRIYWWSWPRAADRATLPIWPTARCRLNPGDSPTHQWGLIEHWGLIIEDGTLPCVTVPWSRLTHSMLMPTMRWDRELRSFICVDPVCRERSPWWNTSSSMAASAIWATCDPCTHTIPCLSFLISSFTCHGSHWSRFI